MGEINQMIEEGILCEVCGELVGEVPESVGYHRKCEDCKKDSKRKKKHKSGQGH